MSLWSFAISDHEGKHLVLILSYTIRTTGMYTWDVIAMGHSLALEYMMGEGS